MNPSKNRSGNCLHEYGKKGKSITLLKLEKYQLTKKQLKQISQLRNKLT